MAETSYQQQVNANTDEEKGWPKRLAGQTGDEGLHRPIRREHADCKLKWLGHHDDPGRRAQDVRG